MGEIKTGSVFAPQIDSPTPKATTQARLRREIFQKVLTNLRFCI